MTACEVWFRRDFLIRHGLLPDEPPCGHSPDDCPPAPDNVIQFGRRLA